MHNITFILIFSCLACAPSNHISPDFCKILNADQSYINNDKSDKYYSIDRKKRHAIYQNNFKEIMHYIEHSGFPSIHLNKSNVDSCKYNAITLTFIHVAQSKISTFFKPKTKKILLNNLASNVQLKQVLTKSILVAINTNSIDCSDMVELESFVNLFQLGSEEFQNEILGSKLKLYKETNCND
jgi:hypothetical protein